MKRKEVAIDDAGYVTIFRMKKLDEIPGLEEQIKNLQTKTSTEIVVIDEPAVLGEFGGRAIDIILSDPIQAAKSAVEIGILLWGIVKIVKAAGKVIQFGKKIAQYLLFAKLKIDYVDDQSSKEMLLEKAKIWGPMEIDPIGGSLFEQFTPSIEGPFAFLMAIVIPIQRKRARTFWYIIRTDGDILATWRTQTFIERLPDFLKPI